MAFLDETGLAHFWNHILARLNNFVPAEAGKGLSSNDFTDTYKEKIDNIKESVQPDWNETDSTSNAFIKNKPVMSELTADEIQNAWDATFV